MWQDILKKNFKHKIDKDELILQECPYCKNPRYNLQISLTKGIWQCWACGKHGHIEQFFKDQNLHFDKTGWQSSTINEPKKIDQEILSLDGFVLIDYDRHKEFLKSKGLDKEDEYKYDIMTTYKGKYKSKIIIPLKEGNQVLYFMARDMFSKGKYYNPTIDRKPLLLYYLGVKNRLTLYLVEGTFDAISVNKLGYTVGILLGSGISKEQMVKIKKFGFTDVVVCLDGDLKKKAIELHDKLQKVGIKTRVVLIPGMEDPNDLFVSDSAYLLKLLSTPKEVTVSDRVQILLRK